MVTTYRQKRTGRTTSMPLKEADCPLAAQFSSPNVGSMMGSSIAIVQKIASVISHMVASSMTRVYQDPGQATTALKMAGILFHAQNSLRMIPSAAASSFTSVFAPFRTRTFSAWSSRESMDLRMCTICWWMWACFSRISTQPEFASFWSRSEEAITTSWRTSPGSFAHVRSSKRVSKKCR